MTTPLSDKITWRDIAISDKITWRDIAILFMGLSLGITIGLLWGFNFTL